MPGKPYLFTLDGDDVKINVRLTPKSSKNSVLNCLIDADGVPVLRCVVTAVPENGKANKALIKMLAKIWQLPKTSLTILRGQHDRHKTLLIKDAGKDAYKKLVRWAETL